MAKPSDQRKLAVMRHVACKLFLFVNWQVCEWLPTQVSPRLAPSLWHTRMLLILSQNILIEHDQCKICIATLPAIILPCHIPSYSLQG